MKAAIFNTPGAPITIDDVSDPEPGEGEVVIKVSRCGVCGTDLELTGGHGQTLPPGSTLGHEYGGEVVAVGKGVDTLKCGDNIAAFPIVGCGSCDGCATGLDVFCPQMLHLMVRVIPNGRFTSQVGKEIAEGTTMKLRGPLGQFAIRLSYRPIIFVAGGTGIAPVLSMLSDLIESNNERPATFLYGARTVADLPMVDKLRELEREHDWFTFIPALSDPDGTPWDGETGLITEVLSRHFPSTKGLESYLCGPPAMIDAALDVLTSSGCKERHIFFDRFVPSG